MMKYLRVLLLFIFFLSCKPENKIEIIGFEKLHLKTKNLIRKNLDNKIKSWKYINLNPTYKYSINYKNNYFLNEPLLEFSNNKGDIVEISLKATSMRIFFIDTVGVYFPIVSSFGYNPDDSYSKILKNENFILGLVKW